MAQAATAEPSNTRRFGRLPASMRVFMREQGRPFGDDVKDISYGGLCIKTSSPLPPGTQSVFAVQLPHHDAPLELKGHVVWSSDREMGVSFDSIDPLFAEWVARMERDRTRL